MAKLWQKNYTLNSLIEEFTVGRDYILDQRLVPADCAASMAHGEMLRSIGLLNDAEYEELKEGLLEIITRHKKNEFSITPADEDCHTAIENYLTEKCGDAGKKIHVGRSRNDQVLAALRLYTRGYLQVLGNELILLIETLVRFSREHEFVPMPGRTHMQLAMPSSLGLWAGAYAEELADLFEIFFPLYELNNQCPLGSAASYGVPLPLDRERTAESLGFDKIQNNVLYVNNSRGKIEGMVLDFLDQIGLTLSKLAQDCILFSLPEFGYFSLPGELCSGSSIMPQKKNPDALELARARSASLSACSLQVKSVLRSLPSGYNRDFQETKEPFFRGMDICLGMVRVFIITIEKMQVHEDRLVSGFLPEIFATDQALDLVKKGVPFRDAYRKVGMAVDQVQPQDPVEVLKNRTSTGSPGNLRLNGIADRTAGFQDILNAKRDAAEKAVTGLTGIQIDFCSR